MASLDEHTNGTSVTLAVGESVTLSLPENPTIGYRWRITEDGGPVLRLQEDGFTPGGPALGAGGTHRWTWQAVQPGQAGLRLGYVRPWGTDPAARQFAVTIRVGG
jgi:inhibitor of cysteine peptidase